MKYVSIIVVVFLFSCVPVQKVSPITEAELFNKTVPAVVVVYSFDKNNELMGQGTGFVLTNTGTIATNHHVIKGSYSLRVAFMTGEKYDVNEIIAIDEHRDIAILNIQGFDLPIIRLGNSNNISIGEKVIAIGNPLGLSNTLSSGIISGIRTDLEDYKLIQTTTPISPGSSGGPLLNMKGEVVGITTMYLKGGQNLNFAVPINYLIALNSQEGPPRQITYSSEDLELKKELAEKYYNEAEYVDAAKLFFEITKADSTDPSTFFKLGFSLHRIAVNLGPHNENDPKWEEFAKMAIDNFSKSVKLNPENEFGFVKIARVYGLWMIDAIKNKRPAKLREALKNAQQSGGFFPFVLETNRAILTSCSENSILFTNGDDDTFPAWYLQEIEKVRNDVTIINLSLLRSPFYVKYLRDFKGIDFNLTDTEIENMKPRNWPRPRDEIINLNNFDKNQFHVKNLRLSINHSYITEDWDYLSVPDQLVLNILRTYIDQKDLYFGAISWTDYSVPFSCYNHTVTEGLVNKIVSQPIERIKSYNKWEKNLLTEYRYSIFSDPRIFGENISYNFIGNYRKSFNDLATIYQYRANRVKVKGILEFKDNVIPKNNIPIPWDELTDLYEDGELKKLYEFAGSSFKEFDYLDEISKEIIETSWEPAALDSPYYYFKIGDFYLDKKAFSKSRKYLKEYLKYEPKDKRATASIMYIEFEENNYNSGLSIAYELLEEDPENIYFNFQLGKHFISQKEYEKASKYFDKVLYVDDQDYDTYNSYGLLYLYQNKYQQALTNFEKVLEYSPSYVINRKYALENIAETYKAMGNNKKSIETYFKLIESDPTMCLAYSKLAILFDLDNNEAISVDLLQIAKDNMWEDSYGQIGLACYYSYIGDIKMSLNYLETAVEMGFSDFSWLEFDPDLENVRNTDEFWEIINE